MRNVLALVLVLVLGHPAWAQDIPRPAGPPRVAKERIVLRTTLGDLVLALYPDAAPKTVAKVLELTRLGVYDTTHFYRIEPNFVAQIGVAQDRIIPLTAAQAAAIKPIELEVKAGLKHERGVLSMAHGDDPNSNETSFSILFVSAPHLDDKYTIFGHLERGHDVLDAIARVDRDSGNRPRFRLEVERAVVVDSDEQLTLLRGARAEPPKPKEDLLAGPVISRIVLVVIMMVCGIATFVLAGRATTKTVGALGLLTVLVGAFYLFAVLIPVGREKPWVATSIFFSFLAMLKLMSNFESPRG